jgi:O-methyltransferase
LYAKPPVIPDDAPVHWYHSMVLPVSGEVTGEWDLRPTVDEYLGHVDYSGKRVLEIGPASGYLTFEMERRGAEVVCVELPPGAPFDMVPFASIDQAALLAEQGDSLLPLHNGFWRAHAEHRSRARVHHGDAMKLTPRLGTFDVSIMTAVLQHLHDPVAVVTSCAARTRDTIVITDLDGTAYTGRDIDAPVLELFPAPDRETPFTWWMLRPRFFEVLLGILGFGHVVTTRHDDLYAHEGRTITTFTVVGRRTG